MRLLWCSFRSLKALSLRYLSLVKGCARSSAIWLLARGVRVKFASSVLIWAHDFVLWREVILSARVPVRHVSTGGQTARIQRRQLGETSILTYRQLSAGSTQIERYILLADLHQVISVLRVIIVVLVHFLLGNSAAVIEETLGKSLIFALNSLILLLSYWNVQWSGTDRCALWSESKAARLSLTAEVRNWNVLRHAPVLLEHLTDALRSHGYAAPFATGNFDELVK